MEQIRSADVLASFPQVDEEKLNAALAAEAAASNRKIIVLDDDPTGVQTVHDIYVYTDWTVESLRKGFAAPEKLFFILTNSRGFTVAETTKAHREIAENTAKVAREFGMDYLIISRGDSTLRGHYPLETDLLREVTEAENGYKMDGDILCPYFREGGRFTLDNVHYVRYGAELVPCAYDGLAWDGGTAWVKLSDGWHEYTIPGVTKPDPLADLPDSVTAPDTYPARTDAVFFMADADSTNRLNLRAGPGLEYDILGKISFSTLRVYGYSSAVPGWALVRYDPLYDVPQFGWVSTAYLISTE